MTWLRKLFGLDFPDPAPGQLWRSRHNGRHFLVCDVRKSDDGRMFRISTHTEGPGGKLIGVAMIYTMYPDQWRRLLREDGRELVRVYATGGIVPDEVHLYGEKLW